MAGAPPSTPEISISNFEPYVSPDESPAEFTGKAIILGIILSLVMTAANAYLGLYAGTTVSAAIPAAVISMIVFSALFKTGLLKDKATVLEVNLAKTMASAGESLAAGVIFTIPALIVIGYWDEIHIWETMAIALVGGLLGVIFTIPLRRILIIDLDLKYPESVATTEVVIASEKGGSTAQYVFTALAAGALWQISRLDSGFHLWAERFQGALGSGRFRFYGGSELSAALMSVGYIIGLRVSSFMIIGGVIGWILIIPTLGFVGEMGWYGPGWSGDGPGAFLSLWATHLRYVGVGAMIVAASYTIYIMREAITKGLSQALRRKESEDGVMEALPIRTEHDLDQTKSMILALFFVIPIFIIYYHFSESVLVSGISAVVMLIAAFFFACVAGYIAGILGSSSNPISGVTIATLAFTSLLLSFLGLDDMLGMATAIGVAAVVCVAAAIAGDVLQDLKTGQLLGSTPRHLQVGEFIGVTAGALVIGPTLFLLFNAFELGSQDLPAPQAFVMASIVQGIFTGNMRWEMVILGMAIIGSIIVYKTLTDSPISPMAVAVGLYLPFTTAMAVFVGGLIKEGTEKFVTTSVELETPNDSAEQREEKVAQAKKSSEGFGILFASGLIAGEAIMGVIIALFITLKLDLTLKDNPYQFFGLLGFVYLGLLLTYMALREFLQPKPKGHVGQVLTRMKDDFFRWLVNPFNG